MSDKDHAEKLITTLTKSFGIYLNQSGRDRYSTARVSKRLTYLTAACLRARYCTDLRRSNSKKHS